MFKPMNSQSHYKMYKKGKFWVVAGIFTATLTFGTMAPAHADATPQSEADTTTITASSATDATKSAPASSAPKSVTPASSAATSTSSAATSTPQLAADPAIESSTNQASSAKPAADSSSQSSEPAKPAETPAPTTKPAAAEQPATPAKDAAKDGVVKDALPTAKVESDQLTAKSATPAALAAKADQTDQKLVYDDAPIDEWMPNKALQQALLATFQNTRWSSRNQNFLDPDYDSKPGAKVWNSVADITKSDLLLLKGFSLQTQFSTYIDGKTSYSIDGLQYATNLQKLDLLNTLNSTNNGKTPGYQHGDITDISPIKNLTNLTWLQISNNRVSDITPLENMKKLTYLSAVNNSIQDFSMLNEAQFTDSLNIIDQEFYRDPVYIKAGQDTVTLSNMGVKLPQNHGATVGTYQEVSWTSVGGDDYWTYYTRTPMTINTFRRGADGTAVSDTQVKYTILKKQVTPGPTTSSAAGYGVGVHRQPYTYYLVANYYDQEGYRIATYFTPYITDAEAAAAVTVHYQDQKGNAIAPDDVLDQGAVGQTYTTSPKTVTGYTLDQTQLPTNATGTFGQDAITVTYVYNQADGAPITVTYVDENGTALAPGATLNGKYGDAYTADQKAITGYQLKQTLGDAQGVFTLVPQTVTFVYEKAMSSIVIHYQDAQGHDLVPAETQTGQVGTDYAATAKTITGYKLVTTPVNATGQFTATPQTVTFVYDQAMSSITIHYQDTQGHDLVPAETQAGQVGTDYAATAKTITGYKLVTTPANATGKFTENAQTITFVYDQQMSSIVIRYQDKQGHNLLPAETQAGQVGTAYAVAAKPITGYQLVTTPVNATGKFTENAQTITFVYDQQMSSIVVNYQDDQGNILAPTETQTGQVGTNYTTQAKTIKGYKLVTTPANATGQFTEAPQTVTFVYTKAMSSIVVNYQDDQGNILAPTETQTGQVGTNYTTQAKTIKGYKLVTTPANATGQFTEAPQTVTFIYAKAMSSIVVNYQDDQGNTLAPTETQTGQVGTDYTATAKAIKGYKLVTTPANATGQFTETPQTVTFIYAKAMSSIVINYQDDQGNTLAPTETLAGQVGTDYTTTAKTIKGYKLVTTPANATGQFTEAPQTVTFVYTKAMSSIVINYQDDQGNILAPAETLTGQVGTDYTATAKTIKGYKLVTTPANATGQFTEAPQTVTFIYTKAMSSIVVNYQDDQGNALAPAETQTGQVGMDYTTQAKAIAGYTLTTTPANATGQFAATAQTITYVYTKDAVVTPPVVTPTPTVTITVHYQTTTGQALGPDVVLTGKQGDAYTTAPITVAGYRLTGTPTNATGTFGTTADTVTYVYEPITATGGDGDQGTTAPSVPGTKHPQPVTPQPQPQKVVQGNQADRVTVKAPTNTTPVRPATTQVAAPTKVSAPVATSQRTLNQLGTTATKLPQTNEQKTTGWWGLTLLGLLGGIVGWKRRSEK
ncbi:hypothetical protein FD38_GL002202 [Levilactobacillus zymae DSM 19395]|uniref:MucBP domain-containing protein n=3 Tax=Levilactobacillus zymae TaxID=267363 RepID=UPI0006F182B7|nr:MucBP domain-containing protein [Levilactobacillus zymae]KRL09605.1 hypothetical protein FD38_GL002202 [Levilactobacillus zymae DSM 19395]